MIETPKRAFVVRVTANQRTCFLRRKWESSPIQVRPNARPFQEKKQYGEGYELGPGANTSEHVVLMDGGVDKQIQEDIRNVCETYLFLQCQLRGQFPRAVIRALQGEDFLSSHVVNVFGELFLRSESGCQGWRSDNWLMGGLLYIERCLLVLLNWARSA